MSAFYGLRIMGNSGLSCQLLPNRKQRQRQQRQQGRQVNRPPINDQTFSPQQDSFDRLLKPSDWVNSSDPLGVIVLESGKVTDENNLRDFVYRLQGAILVSENSLYIESRVKRVSRVWHFSSFRDCVAIIIQVAPSMKELKLPNVWLVHDKTVEIILNKMYDEQINSSDLLKSVMDNIMPRTISAIDESPQLELWWDNDRSMSFVPEEANPTSKLRVQLLLENEFNFLEEEQEDYYLSRLLKNWTESERNGHTIFLVPSSPAFPLLTRVIRKLNSFFNDMTVVLLFQDVKKVCLGRKTFENSPEGYTKMVAGLMGMKEIRYVEVPPIEPQEQTEEETEELQEETEEETEELQEETEEETEEELQEEPVYGYIDYIPGWPAVWDIVSYAMTLFLEVSASMVLRR